MSSATLVLTAPPSRRSPKSTNVPQGQNPQGPNSLPYPGESWQSFIDNVERECGKNYGCWYKALTSVDGPIAVDCATLDQACVSSVLSTASVIYTSRYPPSVNPTSSPNGLPTPSTSVSSSRSMPDTPSSTASPTMQLASNDTVSNTPRTSSSTRSDAVSPKATPNSGLAASADGGSPDERSASPAETPSPTDQGGASHGAAFQTDTNTFPSSSVASSNPTSSAPGSLSSAKPSSTSKSSNNTGAIVGGVIGALILLALFAATAFFLLRRRRRKTSVPPSAEFMHIARGGGSGSGKHAFVAALDGKATPTQDRLIPLTRQSSIEDDERPPEFTPGSYTDPVFEKVHASAAMRDQYSGGRDEGGYHAF